MTAALMTGGSVFHYTRSTHQRTARGANRADDIQASNRLEEYLIMPKLNRLIAIQAWTVADFLREFRE